jgi:hypothetical protein
VNCSTLLYIGDDSALNIIACYLWVMALNDDVNVSFDNMQDWKGIREKEGAVNSTKTYIKNDETSL